MTSIANSVDEHLKLRVELGRLLAGIKDLESDFASTETLALHFLSRRGIGSPVAAVLADVEACLRGSAPQRGTRLPATAQAQLQAALAQARKDYDRALTRHLEHARLALENAFRQRAATPGLGNGAAR